MSEQTFVLPSEEVRPQMLNQSGQCERLIKESDRKMITGVSRTTWWMMERQGLALQRVRLCGLATFRSTVVD
ncbi:AlpA family transcriptional regulator [Celerinatantimonas sp. YJH-8]|uniref:AlpA family transcriptional regulator n=1 Tax=Celerinatantimonas sp. YJH-8 TaxID=3228714 RepID=UPI0038C89F2B